MKVVKLTPNMLKKIIKEEYAKIVSEAEKLEPVDSKKAEEIEADEYADSLENHVDFYKMNKVKEARLLKQLKLVREQNARIRSKIAAKKKTA